jgi:hypothetical protein
VSPSAGGLFFHYVNYYWAVHPERGLAFFNPLSRRLAGLGSAQCNTSELMRSDPGVSRRMPWAEVRLIPSAWVPR